MGVYKLIFDEVMIKQLKKIGKKTDLKNIVSTMLDKIEALGPDAGDLLDSRLKIYEMKMMHPPLRLYYKIVESKKEAYVFEYEMKTSEGKQQRTIDYIRDKMKSSES